MQILIVTDQLIKEENGLFYCIENLYDILERFAQMGTLHICAQKYAGKSSNVIDKDVSTLISVDNILYVSKSYVRSSLKTKKIIENCVKNVDLVIGYVPCTNASTACKYAKKYKKKYMSYVVGSPWGILWNHGILGKMLAPLSYFRLRWTLKNSDYALYVTEHYLQKIYPCLGITCGCSDVKISSLDETVLNNRLKELDNLSDESPIQIATIANNSVKYKGQHFVIKALANLKKKGLTKFHYHLIGGGDKRRLEDLAKRLNVSEQVFFEGIIPHQAIFKKLDEMHVYIQPSLIEGQPRSVAEAMSRGLLCICADAGAMPEMLEPKYIVKRKSVEDIENVLLDISIEKMKKQAVRNFNEARKFGEDYLNGKRNDFFELVKNDIQ